MILEHTNYRAFLKNVFATRKRNNPSYSMTAFARQIGMGQSALSQVLSGKKNLSAESATRIAGKLNLSEHESEYFRLLLQIETAKDPDLKKSLVERAQALNPDHEVRELSVEMFRAISDWYHLAIKNLCVLDGFEPTSGNIAKRLGIAKLEAETALERLLKLEMIEADPNAPGRYRKVEDYTVTRSVVPNEALRRYHRQMLQKASESLETQTPQEKFVGSETFAISEELLPEAFGVCEEFLRKISDLSAKSRKPTQVYHAGIQFFNLTQRKG